MKAKTTVRLYTFTVEITYTGDGKKPLPQTLRDIIVSRLGEYGHFPGQYSVRVGKRTTVLLKNKVLLRVKTARRKAS